MYPYFVIEHATRGVYIGDDWSSTGNTYGPRFRWSIPRNGGEVFLNETSAKLKFAKVAEVVPSVYLLQFTGRRVQIWRNQRWEPYT